MQPRVFSAFVRFRCLACDSALFLRKADSEYYAKLKEAEYAQAAVQGGRASQKARDRSRSSFMPWRGPKD